MPWWISSVSTTKDYGVDWVTQGDGPVLGVQWALRQQRLTSVDICHQEEMTSALATMRVDYDQVQIKDLKTSNNRLLNKRRKKQAGSSSASQGCHNQ